MKRGSAAKAHRVARPPPEAPVRPDPGHVGLGPGGQVVERPHQVPDIDAGRVLRAEDQAEVVVRPGEAPLDALVALEAEAGRVDDDGQVAVQDLADQPRLHGRLVLLVAPVAVRIDDDGKLAPGGAVRDVEVGGDGEVRAGSRRRSFRSDSRGAAGSR